MRSIKELPITYRRSCRVCDGQVLQRFLHLPQMPFTDDFKPNARSGQEFLEDINIYICSECFTAQTQHDVEADDYYEDYQYSVGGSAIASRFMQLLAVNLQSAYYPGEKGKKVLEVGSGDGEQLVAFMKTGCRVLGYEPSSKLCHVAKDKGVKTIQGLFSSESIDALPEEFREVNVVMLSYTFDHLPDPRSFLAACRSILNKSDGLLVVEIHDLEKIIERQEYCLFEHEHSIYLTEATAKHLCSLEGMKIIDFDLVAESDRRANSLIFVATPTESRYSKLAVEPKTPELFAHLNFYDQVGGNILQGIANLEAFVNRTTESGMSLAGYGAGGRGVMTLAAMNNASKLRYLVDKNPKRPGLFVPKTGISVVGLEALKIDPVDTILVFSFGYLKEIRAEVSSLGYKPEQFHSLLDILAGRF